MPFVQFYDETIFLFAAQKTKVQECDARDDAMKNYCLVSQKNI